MAANILIAVAQWESEMIGVRTADAMARGKANGARYGRERMTPPAVVPPGSCGSATRSHSCAAMAATHRSWCRTCAPHGESSCP
jgi:hypothetical protein